MRAEDLDVATVGGTSRSGGAQETLPAPREIVHVVRQYAPGIGGLEEFVAKLAAKQRETYPSVRVVTCNRIFSQPEQVLPEMEVIDDIRVERLAYHGSRRYPILRGLHRAISSAEIVHVHAIDYAFDMLALSKPFHRKGLVATTHGGFFHTNAYATIKKVWFQTLTRASARAYDALVCCSEADLARFRTIADSRALLVQNGVDVDKFAGASASCPTRTMVTLGRFSSNKRLDRLIEVTDLLAADNPDWHLHICGVPADLSAEALTDLIAARGLLDHVTVHVGLPVEHLREVMGRATFFVSASEYEGFGLALIEAMSAGLLPVVHSNAAFQAFAAHMPGVTVSDFARPDEAAQELRALHAAARERLPGLRRQAMEAAEPFSWDHVKLEYDRVYAGVLQRRRAASE